LLVDQVAAIVMRIIISNGKINSFIIPSLLDHADWRDGTDGLG